MFNFFNTRLTANDNQVIIHLAGTNGLLNGRTNSLLSIKYPQIRDNITDLQQNTTYGKISQPFAITRDNGTFIFTAFIYGNDQDMLNCEQNGSISKNALYKSFYAIEKYIRHLQLGKCPISIVADLGVRRPQNRLVMSVFREVFEPYSVSVFFTA